MPCLWSWLRFMLLYTVPTTPKYSISTKSTRSFTICRIGRLMSITESGWYDMGTSTNGRYLNTKGSARSVSDFALVHSNEGRYTKPSQKGERIRLVSGGHGQTGMNQLDKYGIAYNIEKTYSNGVRVGNIPNHKYKKKRNSMGQVWFPKTWSTKDIRRAGEHVAGLKANRHSPDGKPVFGVYKGVRVGIIRRHGIIATVFPDADQSSVLKKRRKKHG